MANSLISRLEVPPFLSFQVSKLEPFNGTPWQLFACRGAMHPGVNGALFRARQLDRARQQLHAAMNMMTRCVVRTFIELLLSLQLPWPSSNTQK